MSEAIIAKSSLSDIGDIMAIFDSAKRYMRSYGNVNQWSDNYPSQATIEADIASDCSYVVKVNDAIVATFYFVIADEPTYTKIYDGEWKNNARYGVIHRVASNGTTRGVLRLIVDFCRTQIRDIRIDTHRDNSAMRKALTNYGFEYCGIIYLANGDERLAYQLSI